MRVVKVPERLSFKEHGFFHFNAMTELGPRFRHDLFDALRHEFADLPPDPYAPGSHRYRRDSQAVLIPWERILHWIPPLDHEDYGRATRYYQGAYNPDHPGVPRIFPALSAAAEGNELLAQLILLDFDTTWWSPEQKDLPLMTGVHFIKLLAATRAHVAVSSPNLLHQDGEPFHFAHLVSRTNASGGRNFIAAPDCAGRSLQEVSAGSICCEFMLTEPFDSYGVKDETVSHCVEEIRMAERPVPGERSAILIDITPMSKLVLG